MGSSPTTGTSRKGIAACAPFLLIPIDGREATASCQRTKGANRKEQLAAELARRGSESHHRHQQKSLICLPDKSGNFIVFGAETARNTLKQAKTGFGMAIIARPRPVICVFKPKIPRTFYFKLTEQSSRKKLAVGGFEPKSPDFALKID